MSENKLPKEKPIDLSLDKFGMEVAQELGLLQQYRARSGWKPFSPREIFAYAEAVLKKKKDAEGGDRSLG